MKNYLLAGGILLCFNLLQAQIPCGFDQWTYGAGCESVEPTLRAAASARQVESTADSTKTIPVVVHIVHEGGSENISEAQVLSQMEVLEEDYRKLAGTAGDGLGVDTRLRFCLARRDPGGNCTNGIVRLNSSLANHQTYQRAQLGELSGWDPARYLNIYVVKSIPGNVGGYSSFPGGPPSEDGIVVRHDRFGRVGTASSGLGRTMTHEIGHWLGLFHTFHNGCGTDPCLDGDHVCDTPPVSSPNYNCPTGLNSCTNDVPDLNDQVENYMDYTDDPCQNTFTTGQGDRMWGSLDSIRTFIWTDSNLVLTGCDSAYVPPGTCPVVADFVTLTPNLCEGNTADFVDRSLNGATQWQWSFPGGNPANSSDQNPSVTYDSIGIFPVQLIAGDSTGADTLEQLAYISVQPPGTGDSLRFWEDFESGQFPPTNLDINNPDGGVTWELDSAAAYSGKYSIRINNLINTNYGTADELVLPFLDLTTAHPDSVVYMRLKWAYAKSAAPFSDEMLVQISTDCGVNFTTIYYRTQAQLATGPTQTTPFIPTANQWRSGRILLNIYRNEPFVQLKIVNITDGGNYLYLDDIYVGDGTDEPVGIDVRPTVSALRLAPNPTGTFSRLEYHLPAATPVALRIWNAQGQLVTQESLGLLTSGPHSWRIDASSYPAGVYSLEVDTEFAPRHIRMVVVR